MTGGGGVGGGAGGGGCLLSESVVVFWPSPAPASCPGAGLCWTSTWSSPRCSPWLPPRRWERLGRLRPYMNCEHVSGIESERGCFYPGLICDRVNGIFLTRRKIWNRPARVEKMHK